MSDWKQRLCPSGGRMRRDWGLQLTPISPFVLYTSIVFGCAQILMVPLHHPFSPRNLTVWPKSLQPQFSAVLSPRLCGWGRVGHQHLLAQPCPALLTLGAVPEFRSGRRMQVMRGVWAWLSFFPLPGLRDGSPRQS